MGIRQLKVTSDKLQKIMIKSKINSTADNRTKLSAFSLLDTKNKIRYRLADYKGYTGFIGYPELIPFLKTNCLTKNGYPLLDAPPYNPSEKRLFYDYDVNGYMNLELPINFGTEKIKKSILYFGETSYKNFTAELFFCTIG